MIADDFIIDTTKKLITHNENGSEEIYTLNEFYSFVNDLFDEPKYMPFQIPISANSKNDYSLINGWKIKMKSLKYIKNGKLLHGNAGTKRIT